MARNRAASVKHGKRGGITVSLTGLDELIELLGDVAPREAINIMTATIGGVARGMRDEIREGAPSDTGTLKKSVWAEKKKGDRNTVVWHVNIGGGGRKYDAWYWRFIEYGTGASAKGAHASPERPFVRPVVMKYNADMDNIIREKFGVAFTKAVQKKMKKAAMA